MNLPDQVDRDPDDLARSTLAHANRVLVDQAVLDAFGHVSVRSPSNPERFYLARNLAPARVRVEDLQEFDLSGVTEDPRPPYLERFIHAAVYEQHPGVRSVVHSHSAALVPYSVSDRPLRPVMHMAGFLPQAAPVFEIRTVAGEGSDLLIRSMDLGRALAGFLRDSSLVLMRGHGSVAVGGTIQEAVFRAVYAEVNARTQAQAETIGVSTYLTAAEAAAAAASNKSQIQRAWDFWVDRL